MFSPGKALKKWIHKNRRLFTPQKIAGILIGTAILSFGIYNIHRRTAITEGGVLGLVLLLDHWLGIAPAVSSPILDILCYAAAFKFLGRDFLKLSLLSSLCIAGFFLLWSQFPPLLPAMEGYPLLAAVAGGLFVGTGIGLVVRQGGSTGGDDALALTISSVTKCRLSLAYLVSDITVLLLSLTYIPFGRIAFSLITVVLSSALIDLIKTFPRPKKAAAKECRRPRSGPEKGKHSPLDPAGEAGRIHGKRAGG